MNVQQSKDLGQIAGLIATGELETYAALVARATKAEEMVSSARSVAYAAGAKLQSYAESLYAGRQIDDGGAYAEISAATFETAAYEFLKIANPDAVADFDFCIPNSYGAAALWLTAYDQEFRIQSEIITEFSYELRKIAGEANSRAAAARPLPGEISASAVRAAAAYRSLAEAAVAAIDGITVGAPY